MTGGRISRDHCTGDVVSSAEYSKCLRYRYTLTRTWDPAGQRLLYIMLNPSTATEAQNDPTIERCQRRAVRLGFGAMRICNLFAWRETSPAALKRAKTPEGPENAAALTEGADWADLILCAWGVHGTHRNADETVLSALSATGRPLYHLGLTKHGQPRHPLYLSYEVKPLLWTRAEGFAAPDGAGGALRKSSTLA
ncbi:DUF1643 domain-containing protein [Alphaproteobacteria bacterium GH1-50]|uniref:DUF1643 domain-containing protein n=1 Tax=Kangsaoukella pontilimi TaxID=2691042 RepID=A0A7C9IHE6_9RHOB|nr:DUF1643 domain-containing protein [Kangsaoukella pontilimi]MXQ08567.1 DUF1643 domain-containing protein [Kangsaoukella pontilimi]